MRRLLALLPLLATALVGATAAPPAAKLLAASDGERNLRLGASPGALVVTEAGAGAQRVRLPPDAEVTAFAATRRGWVAAGVEEPGSGAAADLLLFASRDGEVRRLPAPPRAGGSLRRSPVPLVAAGHLSGIAWLEGDGERRLAVHAAAWDGGEWQGATRVAPPGPGSQLALSGAVLADGSWLLAWSAFDGADDEILWSVRQGAGWSEPRRVAADNAVPDITPAVAATADGARLAWSRYDGESYRLLLAHWQGDGWSEPEVVGGPGTLFPSWEPLPRGPGLLFRRAVPGEWVLLELDAGSRPRRTTTLAGPPLPRPIAVERDGRVRLLLPSERPAATRR
ncbi:MAG TPA: hypothetical protein VMT16_02160 [Thermoanaerobaculia bacterium]|nr:hypothetical protein [Thermoanaerobaculia bacterium]